MSNFYLKTKSPVNTFLKSVGVATILYLTKHYLRMFWEIYVLCRNSRICLSKKYGNWAVITGSTDGIGKCYAMELARRGINVVLISRNSDKLKKVADEIGEKYGVETKAIVADFSKGPEVFQHIGEELRGIPVGILVNNVGVLNEYPMLFTEMSVEEIWGMVNVNVVTVTTLTRMILPGMLERRRGAVVNLASAAGLQPVPLLAVYCSTKAYVNFFTSALQEEYAHTNIDISCINPMFVATNMTAFSKFLTRGNLFIPNAAAYSSQAINALGRLKETSGYWSHAMQVELAMPLSSHIRMKMCGIITKILNYEYTRNSKSLRE